MGGGRPKPGAGLAGGAQAARCGCAFSLSSTPPLTATLAALTAGAPLRRPSDATWGVCPSAMVTGARNKWAAHFSVGRLAGGMPSRIGQPAPLTTVHCGELLSRVASLACAVRQLPLQPGTLTRWQYAVIAKHNTLCSYSDRCRPARLCLFAVVPSRLLPLLRAERQWGQHQVGPASNRCRYEYPVIHQHAASQGSEARTGRSSRAGGLIRYDYSIPMLHIYRVKNHQMLT